MERNPAISLCRVFSMILIILCHIIHFYTFIPGSQFLGEVFNVGVYTFLVISGYLYGQKTIHQFHSWFCHRAQKLMLPAAILSVCVFIVTAIITHDFDFISFIVYLLNLQGLAFFLPNKWIFFEQPSAIAPLWFITVIMLCYCTVPALQKLRNRLPKFEVCLIIFMLMTVACYGIGVSVSISLFYFLTFIIGYCFGHFGETCVYKTIPFLVYTFVTAALQVVRLYLRSAFDETEIYQNYVGVSHMALGIWIFVSFFMLQKMSPCLVSVFSKSRFINFLDTISLYVYMTHSIFIVTPLSPYRYTDNLVISTVVFLMLSFVSAAVLRWLTKMTSNICSKIKLLS